MPNAPTLRATLLAASLLGPVGAHAQAGGESAPLRVAYAITLIGLPIGTADLAASFVGAAYTVKVGAKLTGLAGMFNGGKGAAVATGSLGPRAPMPTSYAVTSTNTKETRTVRVALTRGDVTGLEIAPPLDPAPDRVAISAADKRGVLDPLSAMLVPVALAPGAAPDPGACARSLPVFDGAARYDIRLAPAGTRRVSIPGLSGPVIACSARYVPVSGHRSERPGTKFMAQNREIEALFAPSGDGRLLVPVRISVKTQVGTAVIEAVRASLGTLPPAGPRAASTN